MRIIKDYGLKIAKQNFQISCEIVLDIPLSSFERYLETFKKNHKLEVTG